MSVNFCHNFTSTFSTNIFVSPYITILNFTKKVLTTHYVSIGSVFTKISQFPQLKGSPLNQHLTAQDDLKFRFATDGEGNYGFLKADDSFAPFKSGFSYIGGWVGHCAPVAAGSGQAASSAYEAVIMFDIANNNYTMASPGYSYGTTYTLVDNDYIKITVLNQACTVKAKVNCVRLKNDGTQQSITAGVSFTSSFPSTTASSFYVLAFD